MDLDRNSGNEGMRMEVVEKVKKQEKLLKNRIRVLEKIWRKGRKKKEKRI